MTDSTDPTQRRASQRRPTPVTKPKVKAQTYVPTDELPADPEVTVLFEGLLWFMYHGSQECQIGIHNASKTYWPHSHEHELEVKVWEKDGSTCSLKYGPYHFAKPKKEITGIQIDANMPAKDGVYVYQTGAHFYRPEGNNNPHDWRWLVDFEYPPLYPEGITLDPDEINPGIWINHGTFLTLVKGTYDFDLLSTFGNEVHHMGKVGLIAGGYIDLKRDGNVTVTIRKAYPHDPVIMELPWHATKRYQIDIRNACMKNGVRCEAGDYGGNGNDFFLYNKTFKEPSGRRKYTLHRVQQYKSLHEVALSDRANRLCFTKADKQHMESNNEAPCGPACASGGGG